MSRMPRVVPGGWPFHVLNRSVGRRTVFESAADYEGFIETVAETLRIRRMRICGYCVMPNHWHMVLWPPQTEGELSSVRASANRGRPYGDEASVNQVAERLALGATLRPRGRPRGNAVAPQFG